MNHKLNKKKVAFVIIIAVLIISLGVFLFNNVNQSTKKETPKTIYDNKVLSHNNLYHSLEDPLNIIIDHKSRDLAEYIKISLKFIGKLSTIGVGMRVTVFQVTYGSLPCGQVYVHCCTLQAHMTKYNKILGGILTWQLKLQSMVLDVSDVLHSDRCLVQKVMK